jgi:hypothetical protein
MTAVPLKATAQYVGGLAITAFFVVLLSLTFSFLGTLFCAALAGMMLGTLRTRKWHAIPVSLLFPLVIFTLLKGMRTELGVRQVVLVSVACFSIFWLIYALAAALFFFERKGQPPAGSARPVRLVPPPTPEAEVEVQPADAARVGAPKRNGSLSLEMLQGNWAGKANGQPQYQSRRIIFQGEGLTLVGMDSSGQAKVLGQAEVRLCPSSSPQMVQLWRPAAESASDTLISI